MSSKPVEGVLDKLTNVKKHQRTDGRVYWKALCPAHDDRHASLCVEEGRDGRAVIKCYAGCTTDQIVSRIGLTLADLFEKKDAPVRVRRKKGGGPPIPSPIGVEHSNASHNANNLGCTLADYAAMKKLSVESLRSYGMSDTKYMGASAIRIPYPDERGVMKATQFRTALTKGEGPDNRFRWKGGDKPCLYGLWRLPMAREAGYIVLGEGASDCHTLWHHGIPALGIPGAGNWKEERDAPHLDGIPIIYVVIEPDAGGEAVRKWLAQSVLRARVRLISFGEHKDPSALHIADPEAFESVFESVFERAIPWTEQAATERQEEAAAAYALARDSLEDSELLAKIGAKMRERGYAGDVRPPQLVYVAATSRLLERPQNIAVIAQSASGKNRCVDEALAFIPPAAVYTEKAGSARALVYTDEHFEHRIVFVSEADSIPEDGPAASAVRSIAADNEMAYDVVERDEETGRFTTRHIVKPGPTGLITTSTRSLGTQMGTRMLEVPLSDDVTQTRAVMRAHAKSVMPTGAGAVELAPFLAVQEYLQLAGERRVAVPFAAVLSERAPAKSVRMRRDFRQLLTCIQAIAFLHQEQRGRTPEGWVAATIEDYALARDLLAPIFDVLAAEGVTPAIRATVEAIAPGEEVSAAQLGARLELAKATVSYRVRKALDGGWLVNNELRRGLPAKLMRGVPLPEHTAALPDPAVVQEVFEHSNGVNTDSNGESPVITGETGEAFECSNGFGERDAAPPLGELPAEAPKMPNMPTKMNGHLRHLRDDTGIVGADTDPERAVITMQRWLANGALERLPAVSSLPADLEDYRERPRLIALCNTYLGYLPHSLTARDAVVRLVDILTPLIDRGNA